MSYLSVLHIAFEFLESFEEAKVYRDKFRPQEPVVYNPNQLDETPPPPSTAMPNSVAISPISVFIDEELTINDTNSMENDPIVETNSTENEEAVGGETDAPDDEKDPLAVVTLEQAEIEAFNNIFGESDENEDDTNNSISLDINNQSENEPQNLQQENESDELTSTVEAGDENQKVIEDIGDDCQIIYERGRNIFKPVDLGFQTKLNDQLSGNMPYKENVGFSASITSRYID